MNEQTIFGFFKVTVERWNVLYGPKVTLLTFITYLKLFQLTGCLQILYTPCAILLPRDSVFIEQNTTCLSICALTYVDECNVGSDIDVVNIFNQITPQHMQCVQMLWIPIVYSVPPPTPRLWWLNLQHTRVTISRRWLGLGSNPCGVDPVTVPVAYLGMLL